MPNRIVLVLIATALLAGCGRDDAVPTSEDNVAMDAAAKTLDNAAADLNSVDDRLPDVNESGPPASANGPSPRSEALNAGSR